MRAAVIIGVLTVLGLGACTSTQSGLPVRTRPRVAAYDSVLEAHTRSSRVYEGVERILVVTATFQAAPYLDARFVEDARVHARTAPESAAVRQAFTEANPGATVVLFFDATLPGWEDLTRRESIWRVALEVDGAVHDPSDVRELDEENEDLRHLFPYTNPFGSLYLVRYPVGVESLRPGAVLRVAGPPARVELTF